MPSTKNQPAPEEAAAPKKPADRSGVKLQFDPAQKDRVQGDTVKVSVGGLKPRKFSVDGESVTVPEDEAVLLVQSIFLKEVN